MVKTSDGRIRGKMTSYAFFVQTCREEQRKKHPEEHVVFTEFSRKCAEKWKVMAAKDKKRFEEMAEKDKVRFEGEMSQLLDSNGTGEKRKKLTQERDRNAPKRPLAAFFFFCNDERANVKAAFPNYGVGEISKELGKRWETCPNKSKYESLAARDKERYSKEYAAYSAASKRPKVTADNDDLMTDEMPPERDDIGDVQDVVQ